MNNNSKLNGAKKGKSRLFLLKSKRFIKKLTQDKRQRFISSVILLSIVLFISEHFLGKSGVYFVFLNSFFTVFLLYLCLKKDLRENFSPQIFILPFLFSLAFGLFYLLTPARYITRIIITSLYAVGLYSLFLSENIFTVSSIRTIALLSSARTVSITLSLLTYFFLSNVVFSLHFNLLVTLFLIFSYTLPIVIQGIWIYTLEKKFFSSIFWVICLTICLLEIAVFLWFWPSTPTLIALFLAGVYYTFLGLTHVWLEKRFFKGVLWEYFIVIIIILTVLLLFTFWN